MSKFNTSNAANSIVNIIQTSIGNAAFDTTIRAIVQEKVDEATGKFKLQYQDGLFYAFADDVKVNYSKGTEVFVLVPKNDFTQDKRIIGSVKTLGEDYVSVLTYDERYKKIGKSAFADNPAWFGIKSKAEQTEEQSKVLYDKDTNSSTLDGNFLSYLKKENVNGLWLEGTFKTYLNQIQDFNGANYGLRLTFSVGKDEENLTPHIVQLDANSMEGTPFNLSGNRQVIVFSGIDWSTVYRIDKIEFFAEGFSINSVEDDLFVKDIKMYAVSYISDEEQLKSGLTLSSPKGLYIDGAPIDLTATLRIDGKVQRDKVIYYWFIKDPTIKADSNKTDQSNPILVYNAAGGPGWRCLNSATAEKETVTTETKGEDGEETTSTETIYTINWADGTNTWTFDSEDIPSAQATIMCVAKFENTLYTDTIIIYDKAQTEYFVLTASKEFFTKSEQEITLTLKRQNDQDGMGWNTYQWYQQDLYGGAPAPITKGIVDNTTLVVKGSDIVNEATYMVVVQKQTDDDPPTVEHSFTTNPVTLSMRLDEQEEVPPQYTLTIINGDQVFQYSEEGYAPNSPAWVTHSPQDIKELSFVLFDNQLGSAVDADSQQWTIPVDKTLLSGTGGNGETQDFQIASMYNASYSNNQITLTVTYNGMKFTATTNFVFVKQGDPGTNGTDVVIVVTGTPNFNDDGTYKDGLTVKKYIGSEAIPLDGVIPQEIIYKKGDVTVKTGVYKATVKEEEDSKVYYGYYVPPITINDTAYHLVGKPSQYVVYDADGTNPKYADFQFEGKGSDGNWKSVEVTFNGKSSLYLAIPETFDSALAASEGVFQIAVQASNGTVITTITLLASLNRHAFSMVNGWDGNLKIDDSNNYMLAATVAAGKKNEDNTFTGVMIGTVGDSTDPKKSKTGFFSFNQGAQTAFIDAETGSAKFGASDTAGFQWELDPNSSEAQDNSFLSFKNKSGSELLYIANDKYFLQSSNYSENASGKYAIIYPKDGFRVEARDYSKSNGGKILTYNGDNYTFGENFIEYSFNNEIMSQQSNKGRYAILLLESPESIKVNIEGDTLEVEKDVTATETQKYLQYEGKIYVGYNIYTSSGLKINLQKGEITSPSFSFTQGGDATFKGRIEATSGWFNDAVYIGGRSVGSMLASLDSKISSISYIGNTLTWTTTTGNGGSFTPTTTGGLTESQIISLIYSSDYGWHEETVGSKKVYYLTADYIYAKDGYFIGRANTAQGAIQQYTGSTVGGGGGDVGDTTGQTSGIALISKYETADKKIANGGICAVTNAGAKIQYGNATMYVVMNQAQIKSGTGSQSGKTGIYLNGLEIYIG